MSVRVESFDLGGLPLEAYFVYCTEFVAVAIDPDASVASRRARELQAYGDWIKPPAREDRPHLKAVDVAGVDCAAVRAIRRTVDELEPHWVEAVRDCCRLSNDPRVIADYCELDLTAVLAILENLKERNELPEG